MSINIISGVVKYKNKLAIGSTFTNDLLVKNKYDLKIFKEITTNSLYSSSKLPKNVIVMGYNTWVSIGCKQLKNRINIVLTNKHLDKKDTDKVKYKNDINIYFMNTLQFVEFYKKYSPNVFVIGGGKIYELFMNPYFLLSNKLSINKIYLTEFSKDLLSEEVKNKSLEPNIFFPKIRNNFKLIYYHEEESENLTLLMYKNMHQKCTTFDADYSQLIKDIVNKGFYKDDRTNVGTISCFGKDIKIDLTQETPLLTTKYMNWKAVIEELLWFLRGDTDAKILQRKGIKIWDGNTSKEFLKSRGLDYPEGLLGPCYGWQWRHFGAEYDEECADSTIKQTSEGFDQIKEVIRLLKEEPNSRRIVLSAWNPEYLDKMVLAPCHLMAIFNVHTEYDKIENKLQKYLNCHLVCRSTDVGLGLPYNIFSYAVLMHILALKVDMKPKYLYYTGSDVHIYTNHIKQLTNQIYLNPGVSPILKLNPEIKDKEIEEIDITDFKIIGYFPDKYIKMDMAV